MIVLDRELRARTILGVAARSFDRDELIGRPLEEIYPADEAAILTEEYGAALRGENRSFDFHSSLTGSDLAIRAAPLARAGRSSAAWRSLTT